MSEENELLMSLYSEYRERARHYQLERTIANNIIGTVVVGSFGIMGLDDKIGFSDLPLCIMIFFLSALVAAFSLKYHERVKHCQSQADKIEEEIFSRSGASSSKIDDPLTNKNRNLLWRPTLRRLTNKLGILYIYELWFFLAIIFAFINAGTVSYILFG
jgi:hypothetical protein